jgi:isopentenyl diphosphate isomerase/L-lactate dehydrogenase-like FMN-dependent dehydrogenase
MEPTSKPSRGMLRQLEIYATGEPAQPTNIERVRRLAEEQLDPKAWGYLEGSAGSEDTARENLEAFRRWRIVPRMMRGVSQPDLSIELLGHELPSPILLAPIGVQGILHADAEVAVAKAASSLDVPIVLSTVSSKPLEDVSTAMNGRPRWFQLYWSRDRELAASFLRRAESAGYSALVVTLDTLQLGWRPRDLDHGYLPFRDGQGMANYITDPVFRASLGEGDPAQAAARRFAQVFADPSLTWESLPFLREHTRMPILVKGILHPDDARRAVACGVDGVIVSNHGGRQVDGGIAALDALPGVVEAVGSRVPVLFDSGIRRGSDVIKALALGARAVLIGKPYLWGLSVAGAQGVSHVVQLLRKELEVAMALCGTPSLAHISTSLLASPSVAGAG